MLTPNLAGIEYCNPCWPTDGVWYFFHFIFTGVLNKIYHSQHCQHRVICGDFNIDIKDNPNAAHPSLPSMDQIIEEPTYFAGGTYTSLLDHIYIQNCTIFMSGVLDTYYSDHDAIFADIALHGYQQWVPQLTRSGLKGDLYVIFRH